VIQRYNFEGTYSILLTARLFADNTDYYYYYYWRAYGTYYVVLVRQTVHAGGCVIILQWRVDCISHGWVLGSFGGHFKQRLYPQGNYLIF